MVLEKTEQFPNTKRPKKAKRPKTTTTPTTAVEGAAQTQTPRVKRQITTKDDNKVGSKLNNVSQSIPKPAMSARAALNSQLNNAVLDDSARHPIIGSVSTNPQNKQGNNIEELKKLDKKSIAGKLIMNQGV